MAEKAYQARFATEWLRPLAGPSEVTYYRGYPVMVNSDAQTDFAADVARSSFRQRVTRHL